MVAGCVGTHVGSFLSYIPLFVASPQRGEPFDYRFVLKGIPDVRFLESSLWCQAKNQDHSRRAVAFFDLGHSFINMSTTQPLAPGANLSNGGRG